MKKLLLSAVAFTALAVGPALGADLGRRIYKAPPPPPPPAAPVYSWTGWYAGLNAGGGWSNDDGIDNTIVSTFCNTALVGCRGAPASSDAAAAAVPAHFDTKPSGFIGGGQVGYNFQTAPSWVWGVEADFQGADIKGDATATGTAVPVGFPNNPTTVVGTGSQKLDFLGTLRGRAGWTPINPLLLYVTGGLAYGHVKTDVSFSQHDANCTPCGPDAFTSASNDEWRAGWTVGGGLEWMFAPHWSLKGEYLYYDLGHVTLNSTLTQISSGVTFTEVGISSEAHYKGSIARGGVNYHF